MCTLKLSFYHKISSCNWYAVWFCLEYHLVAKQCQRNMFTWVGYYNALCTELLSMNGTWVPINILWHRMLNHEMLDFFFFFFFSFGFLVHGMEKKLSMFACVFPVCPFDVHPIHMYWMFHEMWLIITNSLVHNSSWEANSNTASWEIAHVLYKFQVHDWVDSPPLVCTLSHMNQVNILLSNFLNINFSIILPCVPLSSMWSLSVCSPYQNLVCISVLPHMCHVSYPSQPPWFYHCDTV